MVRKGSPVRVRKRALRITWKAVLFALLPVAYRESGGQLADVERFGRYADAMQEEPRFFIRKAICWVLWTRRDGARTSSATGASPRARRASGVTIREAVKYLPTTRGLRSSVGWWTPATGRRLKEIRVGHALLESRPNR